MKKNFIGLSKLDESSYYYKRVTIVTIKRNAHCLKNSHICEVNNVHFKMQTGEMQILRNMPETCFSQWEEMCTLGKIVVSVQKCE